MYQPKKIFFFIFFMLLSISLLNATNEEDNELYKFRTLSPEGGFYYEGVTSIQQDNDGFIWISMPNDIYRFDGYEYKRYFPVFKNIDPSKNWIFRNLLVDSKGKLFVAADDGLFVYNKLSDSFEKLLDTKISSAKIDEKDSIWINGKDGTFSLFDLKTKNLLQPTCNGEPVNSVKTICSNEKNIFAAAHNLIYVCNYGQLNFEVFFKVPENNEIIDIKESQGKLWALVRNSGLFKINIVTKQIEQKFDVFSHIKEDARSIYPDKNGLIWIATLHGLYTFDPEDNHYEKYLHDVSDPFSIPNNSIWCIYEDQQQDLWIGTFSGGLCYMNFNKKVSFETYRLKEKELNHVPVSSFAEDAKSIWIATEGGGINRFDKDTKTFTYLVNAPDNANSLPSNNVKSILVDNRQRLWMSMFRGGLSCYDINKKQFKNFKSNDKKHGGLLHNDLRKIVLDCDSGIWIAYQTDQIVISFYSFKDETFTHYYEHNSDDYIYDICKDFNNNVLWIVSREKLYMLNLEEQTIHEIHFNDSICLNAQSVYADENSNVWIGTIGNGLIKYNSKTSEFKSYTNILKLNVYSIYNICRDDHNYLWLGTDNGLIRYNVLDNSFFKYDKPDGIQGQVFYPLASMKSRDGDLYFGGTNGFSVVKPDKIHFNEVKPTAIISGFFIDNKPVEMESANSKGKKNFDENFQEIVLNYKQTNFGILFSSTNYYLSEKNRYRYRLKGYDDRWIEVDANNRMAVYSKVPPGNYDFQIYTSNNDGVWGDNIKTIKIKRLPAPWLSLPAYIVYSILFLVLLYFLINYYRERHRLNLQIYLTKLEKDKKEEIHQSQLRFFTNISHDFKTPLTLIITVVNKLRQEGLKEYYYKILNSNSQRLLNLVNDLMDFRTIENGNKNLNVQSANINKFVKDVAFDFTEYAEQHKMNYNVNLDNDISSVLYFDKSVMEKIVINLVHNAFKYAKKGGVISIETFSGIDKFRPRFQNSYTIKDDNYNLIGETFSIAVRDNGVGISKDSIENVFERFYKVSTANADAHLGTGIGLALVKSLVLLHKGVLSIYSERNAGTDIIVTFSVAPDIYGEKDFLFRQEEEKISVEEAVYSKNDEIVNGKNINEDTNDLLLRNKKRILLVEDNEDLRTLIADTLSKEYEVMEAPNGMVASQLLSKVEIDIILSDIMMPLKDGITFCQEVKNDPNTSHIPFILFTSKSGMESRKEGALSKADLYMEKPVDLDLLMITLKNIFRRQQKLKEYYSKNYFVESVELSLNEQDNKFMRNFIEILDKNLDKTEMDVNYIASELSMGRSKLYSKVKAMTGKSIVEFILSYRLRKAARLMIEKDLSMREVMDAVGLESQSYFTRAFKNEFGETPTAFTAKYKKREE